MATRTIPKTRLMEVRVDLIDVKDGFNARTEFDPDELRGLTETIGDYGVVQTLMLRPTSEGRFLIVAGERRWQSAKAAGLEKVPAMVGDLTERDALLLSFIENRHRSQLNPVEEARGLKALAEEWELGTHKAIAEKAKIKPKEVGPLLRLLALPEGVQGLIAAGVVPPTAEKKLREVAAVSPRVAECVCITASRQDVAPSDFLRVFDQLLQLTCEGRFTEKPTMIDVRRMTVGKVIVDRKERAELVERVNALDRYLTSEDPQVRLGEPEIDAARAAGCLIEHEVDNGGFATVCAYLTDAELAADLLRRAVDRQEAEARKRAEEEAAWRSRNGRMVGTPAEQKEARRADREQAKVDAAAARRFNEDLGRNLLKRRGKGTRSRHGLAREKALAAVVLADNRELAAAGLRLVLPQLQEVEVKHLKSGGRREKVSYADTDQCLTYLENRIAEAKAHGEPMELLADALIAGLLADQAELPRTRRVASGIRADEEVARLLAADIKAVKPRRSPKQRKVEKED